MSNFRNKYPFEKRKDESSRIRIKYPDRIPTIVEAAEGSDIVKIDKNKFLVPGDLTMGQFMYIIRKRIKLEPDEALFVFVNNTLPPTSELLSQIYKQHVSKCGFLYITYTSESTFG